MYKNLVKNILNKELRFTKWSTQRLKIASPTQKIITLKSFCMILGSLAMWIPFLGKIRILFTHLSEKKFGLSSNTFCFAAKLIVVCSIC